MKFEKKTRHGREVRRGREARGYKTRPTRRGPSLEEQMEQKRMKRLLRNTAAATIAALPLFALGMFSQGTAHADPGVGGDGQRVVVADGQTVLVAKGATASGAVVRMTFDGKTWKALDCSVTSDGAYWLTGGGTINSFPGELRPDCYDASRGWVVDDKPPAEVPQTTDRPFAPTTVAATTLTTNTGGFCPIRALSVPTLRNSTLTGEGLSQEFHVTVPVGETWVVEGWALTTSKTYLEGGVLTHLMGGYTYDFVLTSGTILYYAADRANAGMNFRAFLAHQRGVDLRWVFIAQGWTLCYEQASDPVHLVW